MNTSATCIWLFFALAAPAQPASGQPEPMAPPQPPAALAEVKPSAPERRQLPPETILAIYEDIKQALSGARPGSVVLSAEYYQSLVDRLERLEKQAQANRKDVALNACRISGQVLRDATAPASRAVADLRIELEFRTTAPNVVLPLGLKNLRLAKALLDGETPVWGPPSDGLTLLLAEPRVYHLALELQVPIGRSGSDARLLLEGLPQAAITTLNLTIPDKVQAAQVIGFGPVTVEAVDGQPSRLQAPALGVLSQLDLRWLVVNPAAGPGAPQLTVHADCQATLDETSFDSESRVRVEVRQGSVASLRFRVAADVALAHIDPDPRAEPIDWSFDAGGGLLTLKLRKPLVAGTAPLEFRLRTQQPLSAKSGNPALLGWLELLDLPGQQQTGSITIWMASDRRLRFQPAGAFRSDPRDFPAVAGKAPTQAYRYWQQPAHVAALPDAAPVVQPVVTVRPTHQLDVAGASATLSTEFDVLPRGRVQELDVRWPRGVTLDRGGLLSGIVESVSELEGSDGMLRLRLGTRQTGRFRIRLEGQLPLGMAGRATLSLPTIGHVLLEREGRSEPAQLVQERGELKLNRKDLELELLPGSTGLIDDAGGSLALPLRWRDTAVLGVAASSTTAAQLELGWEPLHHQVRIALEAYLTGTQAEAVETLSYKFSGSTPPELRLRTPFAPAVAWRSQLTFRRSDGIQVTQDAILLDRLPRGTESGPSEEKVLVLPEGVSGSCQVRLTALRTARSESLSDLGLIPIVVPGAEARLEGPVTLSVWTASSVRVDAPPMGWTRSASWPVPAEGAAPQLVLSAVQLNGPIKLQVAASADAVRSPLVVERALMEVAPIGATRRLFRTRLRFNAVRSESLTVRLHEPRTSLRLERVRVHGDDMPVDALSLVGAGSDGLQTDITIPLQPRHLRGPLLLELLVLGSAEPSRFGVGLSSLPVLELPEDTVVRWARWRLELPTGSLPMLWSGAAEAEQPWQWLGWLRAPQPAPDTTSFEHWIDRGKLVPPGAFPRPSYSFRQEGALTPLQVLHGSQVFCLLVGSLGALFLGVVIYASPRRLRLFLASLTVLGLLILGAFSPALWVAVVWSMQPGLLVLFLALGILWIQRQRWRRQVVMLPGFRRVGAASSLVRSSVVRPSRGQPSTVDRAPAAPALANGTVPADPAAREESA